MKSLILALVLFYGNASAQCLGLTSEEKGWFIASNIAIFADWQTTRDMSKRLHEGYEEVGPIAKTFMGTHPSTQAVDNYFAVRFLANYYLSCKLEDTKLRQTYLVVTTISHGYAGINNHRIGLRIRF